ncbi:hypothetical protein [Thorsellia kenyensis]
MGPIGTCQDSCKDYDHELAPVVCVERFTQHYGSHKRVHDPYELG